jgi:hypothetical protein
MIALAVRAQFSKEGRRHYFYKFGFIDCYKLSDAQKIAARHWPIEEGDDIEVRVYDLPEGMKLMDEHYATLASFDPTLPTQ